MTEAQTEILDPDLLHDADATNQRPVTSPPPAPLDELKTTRMPSMTPPPLPVGHQPRQPVIPAPPARPSWLTALLQSTFPPPATSRPAVSAHTAGTVFAIMGLVFALVALFTGLRGVPDEVAAAPMVTVAVILARALVALGAGALSFALFREAERLLVSHEPRARS
jgi:hypothetical protein